MNDFNRFTYLSISFHFCLIFLYDSLTQVTSVKSGMSKALEKQL